MAPLCWWFGICRVSFRFGLFDALAAMGAGVVFVEPNINTRCVEPVLAVELGDGITELDFVHTYRALGFAGLA